MFIEPVALRQRPYRNEPLRDKQSPSVKKTSVALVPPTSFRDDEQMTATLGYLATRLVSVPCGNDTNNRVPKLRPLFPNTPFHTRLVLNTVLDDIGTAVSMA